MKNLSRIFLMLTATAMISCGDKKENSDEKISIGDNNQTETTAPGQSLTSDSDASDNQDVIEISLTANDQMKFDKNEIRVKAGQTVRLTLEHVGQMEKNVMGHNFVLLDQGTEISQFGQEAVKAASNDYIPEGGEQVIAHTKMLGGGESDTIEFTVPEAGTYDFICSFPGHYALMQGKFIVE